MRRWDYFLLILSSERKEEVERAEMEESEGDWQEKLYGRRSVGKSYTSQSEGSREGIRFKGVFKTKVVFASTSSL